MNKHSFNYMLPLIIRVKSLCYQIPLVLPFSEQKEIDAIITELGGMLIEDPELQDNEWAINYKEDRSFIIRYRDILPIHTLAKLVGYVYVISENTSPTILTSKNNFSFWEYNNRENVSDYFATYITTNAFQEEKNSLIFLIKKQSDKTQGYCRYYLDMSTLSIVIVSELAGDLSFSYSAIKDLDSFDKEDVREALSKKGIINK